MRHDLYEVNILAAGPHRLILQHLAPLTSVVEAIAMVVASLLRLTFMDLVPHQFLFREIVNDRIGRSSIGTSLHHSHERFSRPLDLHEGFVFRISLTVTV